jgi:hypothetical protein
MRKNTPPTTTTSQFIVSSFTGEVSGRNNRHDVPGVAKLTHVRTANMIHVPKSHMQEIAPKVVDRYPRLLEV